MGFCCRVAGKVAKLSKKLLVRIDPCQDASQDIYQDVMFIRSYRYLRWPLRPLA